MTVIPVPDPLAALADAPRGDPLALLHPCGDGPSRLFVEPVAALTLGPDEWRGAFESLERFLSRNTAHHCVGYLGYDLRDAVEPLQRSIQDDLPVPVLHFAAYRDVHQWEPGRATTPPPCAPVSAVRAHLSRADYESRVARVVEHIRAGDVFQANLTQPFTGTFRGDPRTLFWRLCAHSPAPFATYLETGHDTAVLSASPEEFLRVDGRQVRTRPIKGTRPRGATAAHDRALLDELRSSDKDIAELAMIVDLMRNDLGKVAEPGTVRVGPFPEHASFPQVHHLFATVCARLRPDRSLVDLLRATFPAGSITGAPKLRCMEILEDLEVVRRGVYTGAIGWIAPGRRTHLSVAIRTMTLVGETVRINVGGGVTADSDPASEYEETLHKATGMLRALGAEVETV